MRAFRIAYDGRSYYGFQRQPDVPTVEDALFDAVCALEICADEPADYSAAGRTDAGVSALSQTVAFACPEWCSPSALNGALPDAIRAWAAADVPADFHATHDARRREYAYHLHAPALDDGRAREAAARLAGEHDFHNLTPDDRGTVRDVSIDCERDGDVLVVTVAAGGFPRQLVRRLVSLLRAVGAGGASLSTVERVLSSEPLDGPAGVAPAPAYPLVLTSVEYGVAFERAPDAAAHAREGFAERRDEHAVRARVAGRIADGIGSA